MGFSNENIAAQMKSAAGYSRPPFAEYFASIQNISSSSMYCAAAPDSSL
jgi:hypothetical protein